MKNCIAELERQNAELRAFIDELLNDLEGEVLDGYGERSLETADRFTGHQSSYIRRDN